MQRLSATYPAPGAVISTGIFALAGVIGLVGAWIGLGHNSFWIDELFTAWTVGDGGDLRGVLSRVGTDFHPPFYFISLFYFSKIFGVGDVALRAFSTIFACLAILIFILGTARSFSLPARLFGAATATGSYFWFFQSQNARSYTLCLAISAVLLSIALSLLRQPPRERSAAKLVTLTGLMLIASFVHFYMMYESLAVLVVLFVCRRHERPFYFAIAFIVGLASLTYLHLVVYRYVQIDPNNFWIPKDFGWNKFVLKTSFHNYFGSVGILAWALCLGAMAIERILASRSQPSRTSWLLRSLGGEVIDPVNLLLAGVPFLIFAGGVVSGYLMSPSLSDRNVLVSAPFLWGFAANLYDKAQRGSHRPTRIFLNLSLSLVVAYMATIVLLRTQPKPNVFLWSAPFRQSAEWIASRSECRGATIPVLVLEPRAWTRNNYAALVLEAAYGRYLRGYAQPKVLFLEDIIADKVPPDMASEMRRRIDGQGCPVIAWGVHAVIEENIAGLREKVLGALDRSGAAGLETKVFWDGPPGFVLEREKR